MSSRARPLLVGFVLGVAACIPALSICACTPAQRTEFAPLVKPAERVTCIVLRALTTSGTLDEICATADELAPYVPELLASRGETPRAAEQRMSVAFVAPAPARPVPRRHCALWVPAGAPARITDGGDSGER